MKYRPTMVYIKKRERISKLCVGSSFFFTPPPPPLILCMLYDGLHIIELKSD